MGGAVLTDRQAGVGGGDLDVQVGVADGVADLLEAAARHEHGKAGHERHVTHGGHAGGYADHVLLGNAAVKMTVRELFAEDLGLGGGGQIGVQHHHVGVIFCQFYQRGAVAVAGGNFFDLTHTCASSSAS